MMTFPENGQIIGTLIFDNIDRKCAIFFFKETQIFVEVWHSWHQQTESFLGMVNFLRFGALEPLLRTAVTIVTV